jgi:predicted metal-binding protein
MDSDSGGEAENVHGQMLRPAKRDEVAISVCVTCKFSSDSVGTAGPDLLEATRIALGDNDSSGISLRAVQCLGVCKRPVTAAVSAADRYTFVFGDLHADGGAAALASFARSYRQAGFGLVPWRERAQILRSGLVARIPPLAWSPDDGRPPQ